MNEYLKVFEYVYKQVKDKKGYWRKASKSQIFWRVKYDEPQNRYKRGQWSKVAFLEREKDDSFYH